ncbi:MAG: DUF6209 family protein [Polyangiaceae bacterium]
MILAGFAILAVSACSSGSDESIDSSGSASLGSPGVANAADTSCNVVLRDIAVPENRGGVETNCTGSGSSLTSDIPSDATSVALWFETSGDGCATSWDSDYGQNYVYSISD